MKRFHSPPGQVLPRVDRVLDSATGPVSQLLRREVLPPRAVIDRAELKRQVVIELERRRRARFRNAFVLAFAVMFAANVMFELLEAFGG